MANSHVPGWMGDLSVLINKMLATSMQTGRHVTLHIQSSRGEYEYAACFVCIRE